MSNTLFAMVALISENERKERRREKPRTNLCANGKPGYSLENGELYSVRNPCTNPPLVDHIFCDRCRQEAAGGLQFVSRCRTIPTT